MCLVLILTFGATPVLALSTSKHESSTLPTSASRATCDFMSQAQKIGETVPEEVTSGCNQFLDSLVPQFIGLTSSEAYALSEKLGIPIVIGSPFIDSHGTVGSSIVWPTVLIVGPHLNLISKPTEGFKLSKDGHIEPEPIIVGAE